MKHMLRVMVWSVLVLAALQYLAGCGRQSEDVALPKDALQEIPGIDLSGLDGDQQALALKIMNEFVCKHGCAKGLTIAQAQARNKECTISRRLAEIVVENVKAGRSATIEDEILRIAKGADYAASPPPEEIFSISVGDAPTKGPKDAPVTIVIFSDFQ